MSERASGEASAQDGTEWNGIRRSSLAGLQELRRGEVDEIALRLAAGRKIAQTDPCVPLVCLARLCQRRHLQPGVRPPACTPARLLPQPDRPMQSLASLLSSAPTPSGATVSRCHCAVQGCNDNF